MKVIDLLNKIANGEEVPKLIMTGGERFVLIDYGKDTKIYQMVEEPYTRLDINTSCLNDEVEIIEEEKKIPKKLIIGVTEYDEIHINNEISTERQVREVADKLNEVLDYLKSKGE